MTASPEIAFAPIRRIGGAKGWYYANWLWQVRGLLDRLFGGVGLRRGRRDLDSLRVADTVDFWRVEAIEPDRRLRLAAEMKLPGQAWIEFEVTGDSTGSVIRQTATFDPKGSWRKISQEPSPWTGSNGHTRAHLFPAPVGQS